VSDARVYPRAYVRPATARPNRAAEEVEIRRSSAAVPIAIAVAIFGLYLGRFTLLAPGLLGLVLLVSGGSFLSARLNPLSPHFYLTRKPSWLAVGVVFLCALILLYYAYYLLVHEVGLLLPHL
jgi:hypothetical protein